MLLESVYNFAQTLDIPVLGYAQSPCHWECILSSDGTGRFDRLETQIGKKTKPGKKLLLPEIRRNGIQPKLISDTVEYVFIFPDARSGYHEAYINLLTEAYESTRLDELKTLIEFVQSNPELPKDMTLKDRVCFRMEESDDLLTDDSEIRSFWIDRCQPDGDRGTCLVTGKEKTITQKFAMQLKGVPGGNASGASLISAYIDSAQSYNLGNATLSPIGVDVDNDIHQAINKMLADPNHCLKIGGVAFLFWSDSDRTDIMSILSDPGASPETCKRCLSLFLNGRKPEEENVTAHFNLLTVSGNAGRAIVRDFTQMTTNQVETNLGRWLKAQEIKGFGAFEDRTYLPIWRLASAPFRKADEMYPLVPITLIRSALFGSPIPLDLLIKVCNRNRIEGNVNWDRAVFLSLFTSQKSMTPEEQNVENEFLTAEEKIAKRYGRILAVCGKAQKSKRGIKSISDTVAGRSFHTFGSMPVSQQHRLLSNFMYQISDSGNYFTNRMAKLFSEIAEIGPIPKCFSATEKAYFDLGFWAEQQFTKKNDNNEQEEE